MHDPGLAADRTALAWTRSALNMAASGTLIARAAFAAGLDALGVACAVAMATFAWLTWRHGRVIYYGRHMAGQFTRPQTRAFALLTGVTLLVAALAVAVTIAI
ncbi:MAG: DUF202 domain-containing protein [Solirubrobacterales bacterium]|nr:DUF202 domain-containing protein [Solirubrobacterales bacterium]